MWEASFNGAIIHVFLLTVWRIHKQNKMCRKYQVNIRRLRSLFWIKNSRSPNVSAIVAVFNFICRQLQIRFKAKQWLFPEYADNAYLICAREGKRKYGSFRVGRNISLLFESPWDKTSLFPREARSSFFNKLAFRWQLRTRSSLQRDTVNSGAKHLHTVTFETSFNAARN